MAQARNAAANSNTIGITVTSDRNPSHFGVPKNMKYELDGSHSFDNGLIFGGSFVYTDDAFSDRANQNLEGTIGYRVPLDRVFSVWGSGGIGEHWRQNASTPFRTTFCALEQIST